MNAHRVILSDTMSVGDGACEAGCTLEQEFFDYSLWAQAAVQGRSVFVSSGDSGAAGWRRRLEWFLRLAFTS